MLTLHKPRGFAVVVVETGWSLCSQNMWVSHDLMVYSRKKWESPDFFVGKRFDLGIFLYPYRVKVKVEVDIHHMSD